MECLYLPEFDESCETLKIYGEKLKHLRALRLKINDKILLTNGIGYSALSTVIDNIKSNFILKVIEKYISLNEPQNKFSLAIGILDNKDRFEFALEKSVELGISNFFPIISDYTQKSKINNDRLKLKAIAALEQSKRSYLTNINEPQKLDTFLKNNYLNFKNIILCDEFGDKPINTKIDFPCLILVGPEGGFSQKEIEFIKSYNNITLWNLGKTRLRAETAAIAACSALIANF